MIIYYHFRNITKFTIRILLRILFVYVIYYDLNLQEKTIQNICINHSCPQERYIFVLAQWFNVFCNEINKTISYL